MRCSMTVLVSALWLTGVAPADEASAVKLIEKHEGTVTRDDDQPGKPVIAEKLSGTNFTDAELKELSDLKQLRALNLGETKVTDAGLKVLNEFKRA